MTPKDVASNTYLIHLILAQCGLKEFPETLLPNLQHLDLSFNQLQAVSMDVFLKLKNLVTLSLAHNPLEFLRPGESAQRQHSLFRVDLSFTNMKGFSTAPFVNFSTLRQLNLSSRGVRVITNGGFRFTPLLKDLDLSANPIQTFPQDVFQDVPALQRLVSDNYKLCCPDVLPAYLSERNCLAHRSELSSCQDLLRAEGYRVFLWLICVCAVTGNMFCLAFRFQQQRQASKSAFNTFVSSLCLSDFLMGVYLCIIGAADVTFQGRYSHHELKWLHSPVSKVAGFLSFLSSEVSALVILLITLDRFLVLRFPFSTAHFEKRSARVACALAWFLGLLLAAIPLLHVTSHWQFYSQTGICIPLPVTRQEFEGRGYATGVMILFNFVLFLFIAIGQAFIYWSVLKNAMTAHTTRKVQDTTVARRLITVAVTDFLCWFPIGLCGLLALAGVPIPGEVSVAMATFVLPLNSALNPFLYTLNVIMEKRRKNHEEAMLKCLMASADCV
jgi:hypothetical protein